MRILFSILFCFSITHAAPANASTEKTLSSRDFANGTYRVTVSNKGTVSIVDLSTKEIAFTKNLLKFLYQSGAENIRKISKVTFEDKPVSDLRDPRQLIHVKFRLEAEDTAATLTLLGSVTNGKSHWLLTGGLSYTAGDSYSAIKTGNDICGIAPVDGKLWHNIPDGKGDITKFVMLHQYGCAQGRPSDSFRVISLVDTESMKLLASEILETCGNGVYMSFGVGAKAMGMTNINNSWFDHTTCQSDGEIEFDLLNNRLYSPRNTKVICGPAGCR